MTVKLPAEITSCYTFRAESVHELGNAVVMTASDADSKGLLVLAPTPRMIPNEFEGEMTQLKDKVLLRCPFSAANAAALRLHFPWTRPVSLRKAQISIACCDNPAIVSTGPVSAIRQFQAYPVLVQQSKQETDQLGQTFQNAIDNAVFQVFETNFRAGWSAAADHLKTFEDIDSAMEAGIPMISLDIADTANTDAANWDDAAINAAFEKLDAKLRARIETEYAGQTFINGESAVLIDQQTARRCTIIYTAAIDFAEKVCQILTKRRGEDFDLAIAIDKMPFPTPDSHHFFIIRELRRRNVIISALAPRLPDQQEECDSQLQIHARIAQANGNYRISVPIDCSNLAAPPAVCREIHSHLHLKTTGFCWLAAAEITARYEPELYRRIHWAALKNFDSAHTHYPNSIELDRIPQLDAIPDAELGQILTNQDARRLIESSLPSILTGPLQTEIAAAMHKHAHIYSETVEKKLVQLLSLLDIPQK